MRTALRQNTDVMVRKNMKTKITKNFISVGSFCVLKVEKTIMLKAGNTAFVVKPIMGFKMKKILDKYNNVENLDALRYPVPGKNRSLKPRALHRPITKVKIQYL